MSMSGDFQLGGGENMKYIMTVLTIIVLTGCVTPYQSKGFTGGFVSQWVGPDTLQVNVKGNSFTNSSRINDYSLLQAAEKGQEFGYKYFVYEKLVDVSTSSTLYSAAGSSGSQTYVPYTYKHPQKASVFLMFKTVPDHLAKGQYFDVSEVQKEIRTKYGIAE